MRDDMASWRLEKKTAVRAFCTATSQLNIVGFTGAEDAENRGGSPFLYGLFTTVMKTFAPSAEGKRMPARVIRRGRQR